MRPIGDWSTTRVQTIDWRTVMSISPIGGVNTVPSQAAHNASKPESGEVPGAPDHDGDADDGATKTPNAKVASAAVPGRVNLKA